MEDGPLTLDDGTTDVQHLLVEPQDEHVSMDNVLCFNEKIPENAMKMEEVSRSFVGPNYGVAQEGGVVLKQEVLDVMPGEVEAGYFQLPNDFCSMGEDYFSGIEFAQSITNLDYGLSEGLHMSLSESPIRGSSSDANTPWKSDLAITDVTECQDDRDNFRNSELSDTCIRQECETSIEEKPLKFPTPSTIQNISELQNIPSDSPRGISSDEDGGSLFPSDFTSGELFCSSKIQENKEFGLMGQNAESNGSDGQDELAKISNLANTDSLTKQKRSRKPTRRYIDELAEPISRHSKKKQEVSISIPIAKSLVVKNREKCYIESKTRISPEESSVIAIQVPFGSLVHKECQKSRPSDMVLSSDNENSVDKLEDICVAAVSQKKRCGYVNAACEKKRDGRDGFVIAVNQKKGDDSVTAVSQKKRDDHVTAVSQKKRDDCVTALSHRKREDHVTPVCQKKRDDRVTAVSSRKRDGHVSAVNQKKRDGRDTAVSEKKRDDCDSATSQKKRDERVTAVRRPEVSSRRKHHILWTISEVKKLIDGVSQYGVGRWSRIKKLLFSTSPHRTSVDLKDKWRNLLKASGIHEQGTRQGEKKRNMAWRPLPKPILRRVCELATIYPYPNGRKPKIIHRVPPDRSTDITLSDYKRILRSINGN
ncbi:uncharacterized protein LOC111365390 [Olea europaea var. sylvestris]|uniref:uncharacterized protein LOC111365390 n=1 Tax=Olea europaea var. sylvestris TaxID=158386 RepID=UPI000C1D18F4|nr:uncharacterized protein LOC111365390 [Olea europaea var. sylvestris]XP_022841672.1 uncharacterized protein LOC111365390 [Olea europaea var. sylvestris]XP_022841682.1 uncharacterized protein LOC111365390 [Olea europaea var. sylvestris]XP_022841692.1 uncharacterized protein LOC111365390 [Olea europaea var. sylvestris]XP_022841700.1 uncharacterized protein LOC111365390 [Olea europaea var. sylvestris]XP_022841707.1 uncharacterized protein LOC111365390 [Olea europaea var. sylvestris]XP_02284171